ncbi:hypothetical protein PMAG_a0943 [Pseudoalteromonas mariniglutinosa NCIMB 1770]|nr:hypothetical protein [Pseudoalteromonas mariniglutinosa NCIMB 1770]
MQLSIELIDLFLHQKFTVIGGNLKHSSQCANNAIVIMVESRLTERFIV